MNQEVTTFRSGGYNYKLEENRLVDTLGGEQVSRLGLARAILKARARKEEWHSAYIPNNYSIELTGKELNTLSIGCRIFSPVASKRIFAWAASGLRAAKRKAKRRRA